MERKETEGKKKEKKKEKKEEKQKPHGTWHMKKLWKTEKGKKKHISHLFKYQSNLLIII